MATAKSLISCARKYIGVVEKPVNNVVFNTKYYGRVVNGAAYMWCAVFIWYIFQECNASVLFCGGQKTALCQYALDYYKKNGRFYKDNPQPGDLVFYKFGTSSRETNHIGIVTEVLGNGSIKAIEGNTSDENQTNGGMVLEKTRKSGIVGFGRPSYDQEKVETVTTPIFTNVYPQKGIDVAAWQKDMNYPALRQAGVKFAVVKVIRKDLNPDAMFETHYKGFSDAGIPIKCVYNYSYATTVEKAKIDAHRVLGILNGRNIPVALDVEDACQKNLGERLIQIINAYHKVIHDAGLMFCVYTGLSFYNSYIKPYLKLLNNTQFWIARYPSSVPMKITDNPNPTKKPDISGLVAWQYSSSGIISEAYNKNLDFDIAYCPLTMSEYKHGVCMANSLRIRSDSSTNGKILGYLKKGDKVIIYGRDAQTGWYRINEEKPYWVSNAYIEIK